MISVQVAQEVEVAVARLCVAPMADVSAEVGGRLTAIAPVLVAQSVASKATGFNHHSSRTLVTADTHLRANVARHAGFESGVDISTCSPSELRALQRNRSACRASGGTPLQDNQMKDHVEFNVWELLQGSCVPAGCSRYGASVQVDSVSPVVWEGTSRCVAALEKRASCAVVVAAAKQTCWLPKVLDWVIADSRLVSIVRLGYDDYDGQARVLRPDERMDDWSAGHWRPLSTVGRLRLPVRFTATQDFLSGDEPPLQVTAGMSGTLFKFDKDDDLVVKWDKHRGKHFVFLDDAKWLKIGDG